MKLLTTEALKRLQNAEKPFVLVNVLPADSFSETEISGAVNAPMDDSDFVEHVEHLVGGKSNPVITYCASKECPKSTEAARILEQAGFTDVSDYKGGAKAWKAAVEPWRVQSGSNSSTPVFQA
jgi:rhodanese-related sulfurtransferase